MEHLYHRFFKALPIRHAHADEDLHLLSPEELRLIGRTERWALAAAVLIELITYLVIFLPVYEFPGFFESSGLRLGGPFLQAGGPIHWLRNGWMLAATLLELYVLLLLNLAAVHGIAVATGYIRRDGRATETGGLIRIALEKRSGEQQVYGIDPFQGMTPSLVYLYLLLNRLKGLIGSVLVRAALTNLFGRELLRVYLDFSGMPIYMAINLYTTHAILRNARVVIMGQTSIEIIVRRLPKLRLDPWEGTLIYDTLQYIAVNKRDFHANHYHLTKAVVEHFGIPVEPAHPLPADYPEKLKDARPEVGNICRLLIVLGFLLDGRLSWRERRQLRDLRRLGVLDLSQADLARQLRSFVDGQGLGEVAERFLGGHAG
jgi:hypothetical protein